MPLCDKKGSMHFMPNLRSDFLKEEFNTKEKRNIGYETKKKSKAETPKAGI